jgi:hypothetical protein
MVIHDLDILRTVRAVRPLKTYAPLVIDPNAVLALAVAPQGFKPISRQLVQVAQVRSSFKKPQAPFGLPAERLELENSLTAQKAFCLLIAAASNHALR